MVTVVGWCKLEAITQGVEVNTYITCCYKKEFYFLIVNYPNINKCPGMTNTTLIINKQSDYVSHHWWINMSEEH